MARLLESLGKDRRAWKPPAPDREAPAAEWGFQPALRTDIDAAAERQGLRAVRIASDHPEDPSPAVADLFRSQYGEQGIEPRRLIIPCFVPHSP